MNDGTIFYSIEKEHDNHVLYTHVLTDFGGWAKNFVSYGTKEHLGEVADEFSQTFGWVKRGEII